MPMIASLTYWLSTTHRTPGFKSSIERLGQRAHGIRQRSIMDSKYAASPHHFLPSAGNVLLFAASHGATSRGTLNSPHHIALVGCSDYLVILVANLSKSKKRHGPSRSDADLYCGCRVGVRKSTSKALQAVGSVRQETHARKSGLIVDSHLGAKRRSQAHSNSSDRELATTYPILH